MRNQLIKQSKLELSSGAPLFYHRSLHKWAGNHIGLLGNPSFTAWTARQPILYSLDCSATHPLQLGLLRNPSFTAWTAPQPILYSLALE
jgi:hypothetical protein